MILFFYYKFVFPIVMITTKLIQTLIVNDIMTQALMNLSHT